MACLSLSRLLHPILYLFFLFISLHSLSPSNADEGLIQRTCQNTPHQDLCVTAMKSNDNSSQEDDVVGLALIIVEAAIHSANLTHSQLGSLKNGTNDENLYEVIELCEGLYGSVAGAGAFLHLAASRLRHHNEKEYRLAYNDLNITKEYAGWCHEEFLNYDVFYPPLLANREQNLVQICEIALSVISRFL